MTLVEQELIPMLRALAKRNGQPFPEYLEALILREGALVGMMTPDNVVNFEILQKEGDEKDEN